MKKILSFVLVLAMIASMMCINVSAATVVVGAGDDGSREGVGANGFTSETYDGTAVKATVSNTATNMYAVELLYQVSDITISGNYVWDVNDLEYKLGTNFAVASSSDTVNTLEGTLDVGTVTITNFSDMPVYVTADYAAPNTDNVTGLITLNAIANTIGGTVNDNLMAKSVAIVDAYDEGQGGSEKATTYTISLSSANWANVANDMKLAADTVVASYTITISASAPTQTPVDPDPQG